VLQDPVDSETLARIVAGSGRPAIAKAVRVAVELEQPAASLETRLTEYQGRGLLLWPVVGLPTDQAGVTRWRTLLKQWLTRHRSHLAVLELRITEEGLPVARFAIQAAATDLHATAPSARLAVGGPIAVPESLPRLIDASVAPYVDLIAVSSRALADRSIASVKGIAPAIKAALIEQRLPADPEAARTVLIDLHMSSLATDVVAIAAEGEPSALEAAVGGLRPLAVLLAGDVSAIDPGASSLTLSAQGQDVSAQVVYRLLFENRTFGMYLFYRSDENAAPLDVALNVPIEGTPLVVDLVRGKTVAEAGIAGMVRRYMCRRRAPVARC
jgi:hypothetical protein